MKRRTCLRGAVALLPVSLAGCLGAFDGEAEAEPTATSTRRDGGDEGAERTGGTPEPTPEDRERRRVLEFYNDGVGEANRGIEARESGTGAWNDGRYSRAEARFETAEGRFQDARDSFRDAIDASYGIDDVEAREVCDTASEYAIVMREAMQASQRMARAGAEGDVDRANRHLETVATLEREASRLNVRDPGTLQRILDL